jgi:hypothetical protein
VCQALRTAKPLDAHAGHVGDLAHYAHATRSFAARAHHQDLHDRLQDARIQVVTSRPPETRLADPLRALRR